MNRHAMPPDWVLENLRRGMVIPAHPLALTVDRKLDEVRQRALTRYYHAAGAGGLAVGVHTTQFAIRDPAHALFEPVLRLAVESAVACDSAARRQTVLIAGICGYTRQAVTEARTAREMGFHVGLLSLAALKHEDEASLLAHCRTVAEEIALFGFYLQPAVGGRILPLSFWRRFVGIPNVVAIKIAPFNRYQTLEVLRAVAESGRADEIALYTGNDDHIVLDLLTEYTPALMNGGKPVRMAGGLLGQWACGTRSAVGLLTECKRALATGAIPARLLTLAAQLTDFNAAVFDAAHQFAGCIPGIHEVLRRQGLLANTICVDPRETLSPGQAAEIERVCRDYPHLSDEDFVATHSAEWV